MGDFKSTHEGHGNIEHMQWAIKGTRSSEEKPSYGNVTQTNLLTFLFRINPPGPRNVQTLHSVIYITHKVSTGSEHD